MIQKIAVLMGLLTILIVAGCQAPPEVNTPADTASEEFTEDLAELDELQELEQLDFDLEELEQYELE